MESTTASDRLWNTLAKSVADATFVKLVLSKPRRKQDELRRLSVRPVHIKGTRMLQTTEHYDRREIVKNYPTEEAVALCISYFKSNFLEANLFTASEHLQLLSNLKGNAKLIAKPLKEARQADLSHDRPKKRLIDSAGIHWLRLGITDLQGRVLPSMQFKFKQIHQYLTILQPMLEPLLKKDKLRVVDMGAGKGYLTFAIYEYLSANYTGQLEVTGVEQRAELVDQTNQIASEAGFDRLKFVQGQIAGFDATGTDVLIALHACDTATDDAIGAGIRAGAQLIVCAPCCHKQVRNAMLPPGTLPMLSYGILWERQAEILTDTLRALIMEKHGYKSHIQEFIDMGHTPKNLLLTGVKSPNPTNAAETEAKIAALKKQFGISWHQLERIL
ncbi:MAG: SAM-dependent methyltransferase [Bacteroidetes bacterium]|nr:SAM-dependent methyltransferase [Bacteroidota bacterium]